MKSALRCMAIALAAVALLGCKSESGHAATSSSDSAGAKQDGTLTVGFIYVGPKDDYGYNQAHHEGAMVVAKIPGIKIREEENVPETDAVQKTMESMVSLDGAKVLFPTSFGYFDPHILVEAKKFPEVTFLHCGGLYDATKHPANVGSYFGYIDEAQYVSGIVAGMTTKTNKLGFIAAKPIPQVLRNINAFTLGALSVNPKATTAVVFTGDWSMPSKEADAANSLADQGVDVLTMHVDSPKIIVEQAEKRGIFVTGYHASQARLAPKGYLTGAEWNWGQVYTQYVQWLKAKPDLPAPLERWLQGGIHQDVPLRRGCLGRREDEGRRSQGGSHGRVARHLQRPAQGQRGQADHRAGCVDDADRCCPREDGVPGRGGEGINPVNRATAEVLLLRVGALAVSMVLFGAFVALAGANPFDVFYQMYRGSFGTSFSVQNTLLRAAPLMLTALCTAIPARLGLMIIGGEGALVHRRARRHLVRSRASTLPPGSSRGDGRHRLRRRRGLDRRLGRAARVPGGQRDDQQPAPQLHRHRAPQPLRRGADARSDEPEQAVDARHPRADMLQAIPGLEVHWGLVFGVVACLAAYVLMMRSVFGFGAAIVGGNYAQDCCAACRSAG